MLDASAAAAQKGASCMCPARSTSHLRIPTRALTWMTRAVGDMLTRDGRLAVKLLWSWVARMS
eukprot:22396-Eustigmatos_ZCMA.PRE.1